MAIQTGCRWQSTQLRLGIVGRSAKGEQLQNGLHKVIGANEYLGRTNQLHDEPVVQLLHERLRRVEFGLVPWGIEADLIGHLGGSLGNFATYANAGVEWRFGRNLSTEFGTDPLRPEGENVARGDAPPQRWAWHAFLSFDGRAVVHDITLDGNTWKDSHGVAKRRWVADFGYGVAVVHRSWKLVLSQYLRTREFEGQPHRSVFGSLTLVRGRASCRVPNFRCAQKHCATKCAVSRTGDGAFVGMASIALRIRHVNAFHRPIVGALPQSVRCRTDRSAWLTSFSSLRGRRVSPSMSFDLQHRANDSIVQA